MPEGEEKYYEEYHVVSDAWSWVILILFSAFLLGTGMFVHHLIPDTPMTWDYGAIKTVPAESIYSTPVIKTRDIAPQEKDAVPRQLPVLPEAKPLEKLEPKGYEQKDRTK